ncbi:choice-of-anchor L domain-containing protein [uncultured Dokdonia sp.]|uniref:choice-of-anchor L domain-containing protein n=1 Tax=uncultured Dokdonia sp. TaxID=575653 RepID=UPI00261BC858|nr:choice-of-anchor L domain-containing protein [uncultured Dokdonia sp.]
MRKQLFSFLFASLLSILGYGQITIDESLTAQELVEDVLINSSCAEVSNIVSSTGVDFGDVNGISFFSANGSDFPFEEGILLMSGDVQEAPGPNLTTQSNGAWPGDADLEANTTAINTNNASFIEFDFTPFIEQISFDFIMASEEYDQNFECTFSDAFAFILTDVTTGDVQNLAVIPGTNTPIEVTNIRPEVPGQCDAVNEEFFDRYNFQPFNDENTAATNFNGQTVALTAMADVTAGNPYTIKLVVADQGDSAFDIGVFLEAGSFNIGATDLGDDILVANGNAACEGDTITLNAEDPDAVSYMWFMDGVEIVGETNPTLDVTLPGVYSVVVALSNTDCVIEDEVLVEFISADDVNLGDDITGCEGDTVTLDTGFIDGIASYAWFFNSAVLIDEVGPTLDVTQAGEYAVVITFNSGCSFSDVIEVSFQEAPVIELGDTINSCLENLTTLDATPTNIDPADATYSWTLNGVVIAGETNPTLDITQQGTYEVTVTSGACVVTDSVIVNPLALLFELGDDFNTCFEETVTLDASPTNVDPAGATYEWSLNGTIIAGETAPMLTITEEGTYDVTVTFGICSNTDTITVTLANADGTPCTEPEPSECTIVDAGVDLEVDCENPCVDLNASIITLPLTSTSSYRIEQIECPNPPTDGDPTNLTMDDTWSEVIDLPFTFNYYQNDYTSLIIGANGQISFDTTLAGGFNDWNIDLGQTIPNDDQATFPFNTIYGAFHDIDPGVNNDPDAINFFVSGDAPYRTFVLNFDMVAQFSCNDLLTSQQIVLYESLNVIEVNIINKPVCDTWNDGLATLAISGNDNTEFAVPPGRNTDNWEGIDESWRFIPDGEVSDDAEFAWLDEDGNVISNDLIFNVCPTETTTYTATLTFTNPDGTVTTISDDVIVTANVVDYNVNLGDDEVFCDVNSFEIIPSLTGDVTDPTFLWSTGEVTETITVTESGIYTVEVTVDGCVMTDEVMITFLTSPCTIEADCLVIDFQEDFGTGTERVSTPFSSYTFVPAGQVDGAQYAIINSNSTPDLMNGGWHQDAEDNTEGDINGRAFYVNGDTVIDEFYRRPITLQANTDYNFEAFVSTTYDIDTFICPDTGDPSNVIFRIEDMAGNTISELGTGDIQNESDLTWIPFTFSFNTAGNTDVQLVLINNATGVCGNDFAIDDISISFNGDTPVIETPNDINICNIPVGTIDLTSQIDAILNGLDPADFQITFHNTLLDAEGGVNEIASPTAYTNTTTPETIFVRVERLTDDSCFSVVDFDLISIPPTLDLGADQVICDDGSFTIIPTTTGDTTGIVYNWSTGETTSSITVNTSGTVSLTITTVGGCTVTDDITINVESPIGISVGEDFTTCREFPNTLTAVSEDPNVTYEWFLNGDIITGETSSTLDFVVPETAVGTQEYSVVITSALGCTSSDTVEVSLFDVGNCVISQGISPDDTPGFNDTLDLEFLAARSGIDVLQIYNRLGTLVYEQSDYVNQWRGQTDNGNDLPTGTYFYVINLETEDSVYGRQATGWIYINRGE